MAFSDAIERALEVIKDEQDETLVVVTADHSHAFTVGGLTPINNPILGKLSYSICILGKWCSIIVYRTSILAKVCPLVYMYMYILEDLDYNFRRIPQALYLFILILTTLI